MEESDDFDCHVELILIGLSDQEEPPASKSEAKRRLVGVNFENNKGIIGVGCRYFIRKERVRPITISTETTEQTPGS